MEKNGLGRGTWGSSIWLIIYVVSIAVFPKFFDGLPIRSTTGEPPWYFIAQDFRMFLGASVGLLLSLSLVIFFCRKYPKNTLLGLFLVFLFFGSYLQRGFRILLNTENLFRPDIATTSWATHDEYLNTPRDILLYLIYAFILILIYLWIRNRQNRVSVYTGVA